ncbi:hypothetical protein GGX14DRAFT_559824 [Mycena pura]|uniref:N-acetyltransferase domain-containing protein n=1 Tax=Mycena pura TaxID=153505 RepID=A0AAD6VTU7_9AGAR|nr:hypothetical protein GGX14DRAFT_559824 [Mycena pura]
MAFQVVLKSKLSQRELDEAVDVCVKAYVGERASDSMVGGVESLKDPIMRAILRAGELDGQVYLATDVTSQKVVGVAVWFPPGNMLFSTPQQRALGFDDFMKQLSPQTKSFWEDSYGPKVEVFLDETLGPNATLNSFYLNQLATDPAYQGRGIASLLLKTVHDKFAPPFAHCAANDSNAQFYEKRGYTIRGRMVMEAPTGAYPVIILTK